jgi:hypothetical protein
MAEASRRAARRARKGGLHNALFVVAGASAMPAELDALADSVTVTMPWGSLFRGCLGLDPPVARGIRGLLAPGGRLELTLAPATRDRLAGVPIEQAGVMAAARATFEGLGLSFVGGGPATAEDVRATGSSWARRLIREDLDRRAIVARFSSP